MVLIDTSVWIDFFSKKNSRIGYAVDDLLENGLVAICEPIQAELLSGAMNKSDFDKLSDLLARLSWYRGLKANIWEEVALVRFRLARKGIQASIMDIWIGLIAKEYGLDLFTLDKDFEPISKIVHFEFFEVKL